MNKKKITAFVLAGMLGISFMPVIGEYAYAEELPQAGDVLDEPLETGNEEEPSTQAPEEISAPEETEGEDATQKEAEEEIGEDETVKEEPAGEEPAVERPVISDEEEEITAEADAPYKADIKYSYNVKTNKATFTGSVNAPYSLGKVFVDGAANPVSAKHTNNNTTISCTINMSAFKVGYHTVFIQVNNKEGNTVDLLYREYVPCNIYKKPANGPAYYETYTNYMFYKGRNQTVWQNYSMCELYMDYRIAGGKWKTGVKAPAYYGQIKGLSANRTYQIKTYYGIKTAYRTLRGQTKNYFFSGKTAGAVSPAATVKTGSGSLPIKSVKVKAIKVKKHKHKYWSSYYYNGWYTGGWVKEKYYTYKIRITVKMKKKPGVKGIVINGKTIKGNKKKYTATFGTYTNLKKPKGKKMNVYVYGYQNDTYKSYSNMYQKRKKVK